MNIHSTSKHHRSAGFTLIEMLVVFVIIAILIGLLVPVIAGAFARGKEAAEITEMTVIVTNLEQFKDRFGHYPPSQIILREDGDYSTASLSAYVNGGVESPLPTQGATAVFVRDVSVQYLRLLWPQINLNVSTTAGNSPYVVDKDGSGSINQQNEFFDWNGDGVFQDDTNYFLSGDECLVLFLGGIPAGTPTTSSTIRAGQGPPGVHGICKDPFNPCILPIAGTAAATRDGPFTQFASDRLVDWDRNGFYEYLPYRKPSPLGGYAYFSAYDGAGGYRPDDINIDGTLTEPSGITSIPASGAIAFRVTWRLPTNAAGTSILYPAAYTYSGTGAGLTSVVSPGPNPYTVGQPYSETVPIARYQKPESFQLISPSLDMAYGQGGATPRGSSASTSTPPYAEVPEDGDNLSNFSSGELRAFGH